MQGLVDGWARVFASPVGVSITATDPMDSDKSVSDTVALMGQHVGQAAVSQQVREACRQAGVKQGDSERVIIQKVFSYIKGKVKFVQDEEQLARIFHQPLSKELLITPPVLLSMKAPQGDCDDFSMLCCSMLRASGIDCAFVTVAADRAMPNQFTHIYCVALLRDGSKVPLDCSHGKYLGWETPNQTRKQVWPIWSWGHGMFNGMGDCGDQGTECVYPGGTPGGTDWGTVWGSILPGVFSSAEKVWLQTTQQPGYQQVGPNGSTSYVLAPGQTASGILNIPGTSAIGGSNTILYALLGLGGLFLLSKMSK